MLVGPQQRWLYECSQQNGSAGLYPSSGSTVNLVEIELGLLSDVLNELKQQLCVELFLQHVIIKSENYLVQNERNRRLKVAGV
jgi:hypothetical protein